MVIRDKVTGKFVKIIGYGSSEETLRIIHSDGSIQEQLKSLLELPQ